MCEIEGLESQSPGVSGPYKRNVRNVQKNKTSSMGVARGVSCNGGGGGGGGGGDDENRDGRGTMLNRAKIENTIYPTLFYSG
uniref:Uncharacterized protein n=1 Tax=Vespula pensylvanica TaxID=30213 RepID=A0A834UCG2_VESPE|nr:hypothetical protein H0235_006325 [Vespula pensylvanica]